MVEEKVKKPDLARYKEKFCRIIVEKRNKKEGKHKCLFCTVESVNKRCVHVTDTKGALFKIPIESIRGIQVNEEQW